jgi:hypothetical protein
MLARTCTLDVQGGAIAQHQVAVSWTAAPTATGWGRRDGAEQTRQHDETAVPSVVRAPPPLAPAQCTCVIVAVVTDWSCARVQDQHESARTVAHLRTQRLPTRRSIDGRLPEAPTISLCW